MRYADERADVQAEVRRRLSGEPPLPEGARENILVICYGNICRSPFAGIDLQRLNPSLSIRTAGLEAGEEKPPEPPALRIAAEMGVDLGSHGSHRMTASDAKWADLVIGMQGRHERTIRQRWPDAAHKVRLLGDYLETAPHLIEDPWGQEDRVFRSVFERIRRANERLSERLSEGPSKS